MKQVYMPSQEELYIMQDKGMNLYKYLLVKAIESIIMDAKVHNVNKDSSILESVYKYLRDDPYIATAICRLYPEEIPNSEYAKHDTALCLELLSTRRNQDNTIYNLDNLGYFESGVGVLSNLLVIEKTLKTLVDKLPTNPKYRFEYRQNSLLDKIFSCKMDPIFLSKAMADLAQIEPAYVLKYNDEHINRLYPSAANRKYALNEFVNTYGNRYGIATSDCYEFTNKDILTNPDTEVKRLLKCINQRQIKR